MSGYRLMRRVETPAMPRPRVSVERAAELVGLPVEELHRAPLRWPDTTKRDCYLDQLIVWVERRQDLSTDEKYALAQSLETLRIEMIHR